MRRVNGSSCRARPATAWVPKALLSALAKVKAAFAKERISDVDGVRVDFADGWVHLRASNTEPIIRIIAEAATAERANALCDECARVAGV